MAKMWFVFALSLLLVLGQSQNIILDVCSDKASAEQLFDYDAKNHRYGVNVLLACPLCVCVCVIVFCVNVPA